MSNQDKVVGRPVLTEKLIAESLTHGSLFNLKDPKWMTKKEVIAAIKYSHGIVGDVPEAYETKTDTLMTLSAPYTNPHQGLSRKVLFVCSAGMLRSPTAMALASAKGMNARACGTHYKALVPLSVNLIHWANQIVFMDSEVEQQALDKFKDIDEVYSKSICWHIPDDFDYYDQRLVDIIKPKLDELAKIGVYVRPRQQQSTS